MEVIWRWFLCAFTLGLLIPFCVVILFKAELKVLLYLKFKQHAVVKINLDRPDPSNNYSLVAAHGQLTTDGELEDHLTEVKVPNILRIFRSVQVF